MILMLKQRYFDLWRRCRKLDNKHIAAVMAVLISLFYYNLATAQSRLAGMDSAAGIDYPVQKSFTTNFTDRPAITGESETSKHQGKSGALRLDPRKEKATGEQAGNDLSLHFTRKVWEKELLPGLVFKAGEGLSFQWPDSDLRLYIERDDGQYQLLWKQKFD